MATTSKASWDTISLIARGAGDPGVEAHVTSTFNMAIPANANIKDAKLKITVTQDPKDGPRMWFVEKGKNECPTRKGTYEFSIDFDSDKSKAIEKYELNVFFKYKNAKIKAANVQFKAELTVEWSGSGGGGTPWPFQVTLNKICVEKKTTMSWTGASTPDNSPIKGYQIYYKDYNYSTDVYPNTWTVYGKPIETDKIGASCEVEPPEVTKDEDRGHKRRYGISTIYDGGNKQTDPYSTFDECTVYKNRLPDAPTEFDIKPHDYTSGSLTLTWTPSTDSKDANTLSRHSYSGSRELQACVMFYRVEYYDDKKNASIGESTTPEWVEVDDVPALTNAEKITFIYERDFMANVDGKPFVDKTMPEHWRVCAIDDEGTSSVYVYADIAYHKEPTAPGDGALLIYISDTVKVHDMKWTSGPVQLWHASDATAYRIQTRTDDEIDWRDVATVPGPAAIYTVVPELTEPGTTQYWRIAAVDNQGFISEYSSHYVSVTMNTPPVLQNEENKFFLEYTENSVSKQLRSETYTKKDEPITVGAILHLPTIVLEIAEEGTYTVQSRFFTKGEWTNWQTVVDGSGIPRGTSTFDVKRSLPDPSTPGDIQEWRVYAVDSNGGVSDFSHSVSLQTKGIQLTQEDRDNIENFYKLGLFVDEAGYISHALKSETTYDAEMSEATHRLLTEEKAKDIKAAILRIDNNGGEPQVEQAEAEVAAMLEMEIERLKKDVWLQIFEFIRAHVRHRIVGELEQE